MGVESPSPGGLPRRRFSTTAVQAIHQRRRAGGQVGATRGEARRPGSGSLSAATCARTGVSARPYSAWAANPGRCRARSLSPSAARRQVRWARKPQPALGPGPPSPPLAHSPACGPGGRPGPTGDSLSSLEGNWRHRNTKGQRVLRDRNQCPTDAAGSCQERQPECSDTWAGHTLRLPLPRTPAPEPARPHALETLPQTWLPLNHKISARKFERSRPARYWPDGTGTHAIGRCSGQRALRAQHGRGEAGSNAARASARPPSRAVSSAIGSFLWKRTLPLHPLALS